MASSLGGGASLNDSGVSTAPSYSVQGTTVGTVGDALTALNGGVDANRADIAANAADIASNSSSITTITNDLNSGGVGLVRQDASTKALTVAASTGGTTMSIAGSEGSRTLGGVKAGALGADSSEAVNGSQLFATNRAVEANSAGIADNAANLASTSADVRASQADIAAHAVRISKEEQNLGKMASSLAEARH